ncbi:hypothetical protein [Pseudomonas nitroreducens]|uniref:hypothetical protein n=1 Tax=Pseudomonas nitroreducens TaxID=46680 RepID=UPI002D7F65B5|nr:hypothetical protein [Pseudomonas nitroreducens]
MFINGSPLNSLPLAGTAGASGADPVPVVVGPSVVWAARVMLGGDDVTAQITGQVRIERQESSAAIAEFSVWLPPEPVDVASWTGRSVEIFYRELVEGTWIEERRFSGWLEQPAFDPRNRIVSCEATDRLQDLIEAMEITQIDALIGGRWSDDVYDAVEGRSRWDYAQERLGSFPAALDRSVDGTLRVTAWRSVAPTWVFGAGTTVDSSLSFDPAKLKDRVNRIELSIDYRYSRLRQRNQSWSWQHPDIDGISLDNSFCLWRHNTTELPDVSMVVDAVDSSGYKVLSGAEYLRVPLSGVYCDPPAGWTNEYPDLLLAAGVVGGMRWAQPVTEQYRLTVKAPTSIAQAGEVLRRDGTAFETETDRASEWEGSTFVSIDEDAVQDDLNDWVIEERDDDRLSASVLCQVAAASTSILAAHRENHVTWQAPTSVTLGIDLVHTLRIEDRCRAQGKLFSIIDEWDLEGQTALTTLTIAVSRGGGGSSSPLQMPSPPNTQPTGFGGGSHSLPTQLRGRGLMDYDDELDGFSGNYDEVDIGTPIEAFPRRFQVTAPEVPAEHRDEITGERQAVFDIAIPDDLLEL